MTEVILENEEIQPQVDMVKEGIKIGIINGLFALILMFGSYFMGLDTFVNVQFFASFIPYMIIVLIIYGLQLRKKNGGYLPFRDALKFTFLSYVIASLLIAIGTYILFNLVDKDLTQKVFDLTIEKTRGIMSNMGVSEAEIDTQLSKLEAEKKETGLKNIFLGYGLDLIWNFVKSLLITLVIRREKPVF
jgi:amino acid transporter